MAAREKNALTQYLSHRMFDRVLRTGAERALCRLAALLEIEMPENTFEMTPETLARAISNGARRERRRAAKLVDDRSDVELGRGNLPAAQLLQEVAELIRSSDVPAMPEQAAEEALEEIVEPPNEDELPPVRHGDDFADGAALVRSGADRRLVTGYNGASGHLRD